MMLPFSASVFAMFMLCCSPEMAFYLRKLNGFSYRLHMLETIKSIQRNQTENTYIQVRLHS